MIKRYLEQQVRLDLIGQRIDGQTHRRGQRLGAGRAAVEDLDERPGDIPTDRELILYCS